MAGSEDTGGAMGEADTSAKAESSGNSLRERIRGEIDRLYREGIVYGDEGFSRSLYPTSVTPGRGKFLGDLVRKLKSYRPSAKS